MPGPLQGRIVEATEIEDARWSSPTGDTIGEALDEEIRKAGFDPRQARDAAGRWVKIFSYGYNVGSDFERRYPAARHIGNATLEGHEFQLRGLAYAVPKEGASMRGAVYEIPESDLASLDVFEGVPHHYERHQAKATMDGGSTPAERMAAAADLESKADEMDRRLGGPSDRSRHDRDLAARLRSSATGAAGKTPVHVYVGGRDMSPRRGGGNAYSIRSGYREVGLDEGQIDREVERGRMSAAARQASNPGGPPGFGDRIDVDLYGDGSLTSVTVLEWDLEDDGGWVELDDGTEEYVSRKQIG